MSKNYAGFLFHKLGAYLVMVAPVVGFSVEMYQRFGKWGVLYGIIGGCVWAHILISGDDEERHDYLKKLVMRYRHYKDM